MSSLDQAIGTQLTNIQAKTGKTLEELSQLVRASGLSKHSELRSMLQETLGLGYGDANSLVHYVLQSDGQRAAEIKGATTSDVLDEIYTGAKAAQRPIHDRLMGAIDAFGAFEIVPKKGYVSLRRKKQFAMLGPANNKQLEVGLNHRDLPAGDRLVALPAGSMCSHRVRLSNVTEVDEELIGWLRQAYDRAG